MTPAEAREIDRLEFEADCRAARERAQALIAQQQAEERAHVEQWLGSKPSPASKFNPKHLVKPKPRRPRGPSERTVNGVTMTLKDWASHLGINVAALHGRMHRLGSLEAVLAKGNTDARKKSTNA